MSRSARTVLITGAARRIGRVLALDFASRGWNVGVHVRTPDADSRSLAEQIRETGSAAAILTADLADAEAAQRLVPACTEALGSPCCLINSASLFRYDEIGTLTVAQWDEQFAVNLRAPVFLAKAFAEGSAPATPSNIINIIDQRVWKPTPNFFSYAASKSALWAVTRTLAQALAPAIRVNAIAPGPVLASAHQTAEEFDRQRKAVLLGRGTSPEEIAQAVQFILDAPAMTGQMLALDGGQHLAWRTPDVDWDRGET